MNKNGQYRMMQPLEVRAADNDEQSYIVEGYATTFEPYLYYTATDGTPIYEHFQKDCFNKVDINDDVIFQFDHQGRVYARTSNDTLKLELDDKGLKVWADLSKTELSRQMYEDIKTGMVRKMSWGFMVNELSEDVFDTKNNTFEWPAGCVTNIFDVSAVSIPADQDTSIYARNRAEADEAIRSALKKVEKAKRDEAYKAKQAELKNAMARLIAERNI